MSQSWAPAAGRHEVEAALAVMGRGEDQDINVAEAALLLAALDRPKVGLERYRDHLQQIAEQLTERRAEGLEEQRQALNALLFDTLGYAGDSENYDDLQNANLMRVIDRRRGLPVALTILYLHAARTQGWSADALRFPGHVIVRLSGPEGRVIVDPFNRGGRLDPQDLRHLVKAIGGAEAELTPDHVAAMSNREILLRLQNNIKLRRLQAGDHEGGLATQETMLRLAPGSWRLWREAAALNLRIGNLHAATLALDQVIGLAGESEARFEATQARQAIQAKLN